MKQQFTAGINSPARIRNLRTPDDAPVSGVLVAQNGRRWTLRCSFPLPPATTVRIDIEGALALGEVIATDADGAARPLLLVKIEHLIPSLSETGNMVRAVQGEPAAAAPVWPAADRRTLVRRRAADRRQDFAGTQITPDELLQLTAALGPSHQPHPDALEHASAKPTREI